MRRFMGLAVLVLLASSAKAQDTVVVIVRHVPARQDPGVVVRPLAPPRQLQRTAPPYGAPRYALGSTAVFAKNPYAGAMLSFVFPGGGQYYAGATGKGLAISLIAIGAPIIGFANVNREHTNYDGFGPLSPGYNCGVYNGPAIYGNGGSRSYGGRDCRGRYDYTPAAIGLGVGITTWLYGLVTAGSDVQHWNQSHGVRFVAAPGRAGFAVALP
jgi:hypothetical protein